jgi:hypothetical protein
VIAPDPTASAHTAAEIRIDNDTRDDAPGSRAQGGADLHHSSRWRCRMRCAPRDQRAVGFV